MRRIFKDEYSRIEAEEEARLVEESRLKSEEEDQDWMRDDEETLLSEESMQKTEEHKHVRLKV